MTCKCGPSNNRMTARYVRMESNLITPLGLQSVGRCKLIHFADPAAKNAHIRSAQAGRRLNKAVEHGLQVECRAADDLEHVSGRGLLLQRLAQIGRALTQLVEQPRVLDGDDRLVSKVLQKLDLFVGECTDFLTVDAERANQFAFLEHRHDDNCAHAAHFNGGDAVRVPLGKSALLANIEDARRLLGADNLTKARVRSPNAPLPTVLVKGRRYAQ